MNIRDFPMIVALSTMLLAAAVLSVPSVAMTPVGSPVDKIRLLEGSNTWEVLDERRLVLSTSPKQNYLLTLSRDCHTLPFASHLGVSASDNTVYAGFDYITADGQRCAIQAINRISNAQKRSLMEL